MNKVGTFSKLGKQWGTGSFSKEENSELKDKEQIRVTHARLGGKDISETRSELGSQKGEEEG